MDNLREMGPPSLGWMLDFRIRFDSIQATELQPSPAPKLDGKGCPTRVSGHITARLDDSSKNPWFFRH
jgi:hypothetical protein